MLRPTVVAVVSLCVIALAAFQARAQLSEERQAALMQEKLKQSQNLLEGLATENYTQIAESAKIMNALNVLEEWFGAEEAAYQAQLKTFRFANEELIRLADDENIDGAALAYMQLTLSCVNCHKHLRAK